MNAPLHPSDQHQAAARRFGVALVTSVLVIAAVALVVYRLNPESGLAGEGIKIQSSGVTGVQNAATDARLSNVINAFVEALQREDDAAMRAVYPGLTDRDANVLHAVRRRLGPGALHVGDLRVEKAEPDNMRVNFQVVTNGSPEQSRLPFGATIARMHGEWRIAELH
jgi:hypothetical protein